MNYATQQYDNCSLSMKTELGVDLKYSTVKWGEYRNVIDSILPLWFKMVPQLYAPCSLTNTCKYCTVDITQFKFTEVQYSTHH